MTHSVRYLSGSQGVNQWIWHSSWLSCFQSDRLISTLSKSTLAPPVKASRLLWSRWGPLSNKTESWFYTVWPARCEVRTLRTWQSMSEHVVLMKGVRNGWNLHRILQALGGCLLGVIMINTQCFVWCNRDVRQQQQQRASTGWSRDCPGELRSHRIFYLLAFTLLNSAKVK